jgi:predicted house-cleaning noncanonical NTP pyrophosphatase (MazG superfamily)
MSALETTFHRKLVRDNIPAIITAAGDTAEVRILNQEEYVEALFAKMSEELAELRAAAQDEQLSELADVHETFAALTRALGHSGAAVRSAAAAKFFDRGAFKNRLWLESTTQQS